ncbi:MAG TPA: choice-of-anchor V domain-containing protein, partial [Chitinophagales bacterium]|nr:choice-of-anchor V domain-containing protein [Chitinophagales bacterium]
MKRRYVLFGFVLASLILITTSYFNTVRSNLSGAPAGYTGSPGDGTSCISCHSPSRNFTGGTITTNIPSGGYTAGQTYTVTASITRTGHSRIGFELSPQDTTSNGNIVGTIAVTNSTTTKVASTGYVTHKSAGTTASGGAISWTMNWTAPATGHGPVVF